MWAISVRFLFGPRKCELTAYPDMINMIKLSFIPHACCWVHRRGQAQGLLAMYATSRLACTDFVNDGLVLSRTLVPYVYMMDEGTVHRLKLWRHCIASLFM
jgi:hypothetical protein